MIDEKLEEIWTLHNSIHAKIRKGAMQYYQEIGISFQDVILLHTVRMHPNITLSALSKKLGISKSTTSSMVSRMTESGVIIREIPNENRRTVHLRLAEDYEKREEIIERRKQLISDQLSNITDDDMDIIIKGLQRMEALVKG